MAPLLTKRTDTPHFADLTDSPRGIPANGLDSRLSRAPGLLLSESREPRAAPRASAASCGRKPCRHLLGPRVSLLVGGLGALSAQPILLPTSPGRLVAGTAPPDLLAEGLLPEPGASVSHADRSDSPAAFSCQGSCTGLVSLCASSSLKIICFLTVTGQFGDTAALQRLPWRWRGSRLPVPRSCPGRRKSRGHLSEGKGTINTIKNESLQVQRKSGCGHCRTEEEEEKGPRGSFLLPSEPSGFLREKPEPLGVSRHSQLRPQTDLLTPRRCSSGSFPEPHCPCLLLF